MTLRPRSLPALSLLAALLVAVAVLSAGSGAVSIPPGEIAAILLRRAGVDAGAAIDPTHEAVLLAIRIPRVLLGALVGSGLAVSGALLQGLFRNPLADPALLGVSAGGALAAAIGIVAGATSLGVASAFALPLAAFAGGVATAAVVWRVATSRASGAPAPGTLLLAGVAVNALAGAGLGVVTFVASDEEIRSLAFFSLGSLSGATWTVVAAAGPFALAPVLLASRLARPLDALLLGEREARHLGVDVGFVGKATVALAALATGAGVAAAGIVGFVGLVVPHLVRLVAGPGHALLLPASALLGATLVLAADLVARTVAVPAELPLGVVTALAGAPFFLYLLRRSGAAARTA